MFRFLSDFQSEANVTTEHGLNTSCFDWKRYRNRHFIGSDVRANVDRGNIDELIRFNGKLDLMISRQSVCGNS